MDVENFQQCVELMLHSGFKLTELEAGLIENSLIILQHASKLRKVFFFGRLETSSDEEYYLAFGYSSDVFKDRKNFYSLNAHEWFMMPEVDKSLLPVAQNSRAYLTGDPANIEHVVMVSFLLRFQAISYLTSSTESNICCGSR